MNEKHLPPYVYLMKEQPLPEGKTTWYFQAKMRTSSDYSYILPDTKPTDPYRTFPIRSSLEEAIKDLQDRGLSGIINQCHGYRTYGMNNNWYALHPWLDAETCARVFNDPLTDKDFPARHQSPNFQSFYHGPHEKSMALSMQQGFKATLGKTDIVTYGDGYLIGQFVTPKRKYKRAA